MPLWVALHLRKQQKCRILPPSWLSVSSLNKFKENEDGETGCAAPPHPHYTELATLLLQHAPEDLPKWVDVHFIFSQKTESPSQQCYRTRKSDRHRFNISTLKLGYCASFMLATYLLIQHNFCVPSILKSFGLKLYYQFLGICILL